MERLFIGAWQRCGITYILIQIIASLASWRCNLIILALSNEKKFKGAWHGMAWADLFQL
jgi:hypothetical protein